MINYIKIIKLLNIIILYVDEKLDKYDIKLRYKKNIWLYLICM